MNDSQLKYRNRVPSKYRGIYEQAVTGRRALKAIRAKCLDCTCWQESEVRNCVVDSCPLWPYRNGRMVSPGANSDCEIMGESDETEET